SPYGAGVVNFPSAPPTREMYGHRPRQREDHMDNTTGDSSAKPIPDRPHIGSAPFGTPEIDPTAWIAPGAVVVGRVRIGAESSVWYGCVLRADSEDIVVGNKVNIQDQCGMHSDPGEPAILHDNVSLGHKAMVHGAVV